MRLLKTAAVLLGVSAFLCSSAFAAGNAQKGKTLFEDAKFAGGASSCASCHPDGKGLEHSAMKGKKEWKNPGGTWLSLEDANNVCILLANKGTAIDPKSQDMMDLVAYIKSLGKKK